MVVITLAYRLISVEKFEDKKKDFPKNSEACSLVATTGISAEISEDEKRNIGILEFKKLLCLVATHHHSASLAREISAQIGVR